MPEPYRTGTSLPTRRKDPGTLPTMAHLQGPFAALVLVQAAHSVEEYAGRLWESFPPATFLTGLISSDREAGFIVINGALVAFGFWCVLWPVRLEWRSARSLAWFWVVLQTINGIGHPLWSLRQGGYTPGVLTAPLLLVLALLLAGRLSRDPPGNPTRTPVDA